MASIRRTLSPVPRQSSSANGEAVSVGSPLSKSSSCSQNHGSAATGGGLSSSLLSLSDPQALLFGVYSPRSSRPIERLKPKGQLWKRALIHFSLCFSIGIFIGLGQFASTEFSMSSVAKHRAFSSDVVSSLQVNDSQARHERLGSDTKSMEINSTQGHWMMFQEPVNFTNVLEQESGLVSRKLLVIVTPTYSWPFQAYYLNRLGQMLKLVEPPLLWIVVEMNSQSVETAEILRKTGVMYRHLVCDKNVTDVNDMKVHQRNLAMAHIETHRLDGIVYFADDSNMYSLDLFGQMREIRRFGTWKVAKLNGKGNTDTVEGPVCNETRVIGWHTSQSSRFRRFHAEMSGFAFNSTILWDPKRWHRPTVELIRQADTVGDDLKVSSFIEQIVEDETQMEGLPEGCSNVMVWQLHLESSHPFYPNKWLLKNTRGVNVSPLF
ncbi:PREDICTED: probable beta-1,4-xylosyltransferase IRX9H [Tarenaya hassleriana]|uniref:probable beta-1,4-xylosyltransferase IRX9H n=1 Tax=Tarenaya hassleriana TaxID=28532 RepID=UPI00053C6FB8|nr:PREDICTED: probable beta-1,4-xylosyltransferase IRX9H [Tarenaya hassleriana]